MRCVQLGMQCARHLVSVCLLGFTIVGKSLVRVQQTIRITQPLHSRCCAAYGHCIQQQYQHGKLGCRPCQRKAALTVAGWTAELAFDSASRTFWRVEWPGLAADQLWQYFMQYWKLSFAVRSLKAPIILGIRGYLHRSFKTVLTSILKPY